MTAEETVYAYNEERQTFLATALVVADTHQKRLKGLIGTAKDSFGAGKGLWIVPCRGVHTLAMSYPIDVVYLNSEGYVVHVEHCLKPWRIAPIKWAAATVLELPPQMIARTETRIGDHIEINCKSDLLKSISGKCG